jgi:hypothetical protein
MKIKVLAAGAYLCGIPALYIILTDYYKNQYLRMHAAKAFKLWFYFFVFFFACRFLVNLFWRLFYFAPLAYVEDLLVVGMVVYSLFSAYQVWKVDPSRRRR